MIGFTDIGVCCLADLVSISLLIFLLFSLWTWNFAFRSVLLLMCVYLSHWTKVSIWSSDSSPDDIGNDAINERNVFNQFCYWFNLLSGTFHHCGQHSPFPKVLASWVENLVHQLTLLVFKMKKHFTLIHMKFSRYFFFNTHHINIYKCSQTWMKC